MKYIEEKIITSGTKDQKIMEGETKGNLIICPLIGMEGEVLLAINPGRIIPIMSHAQISKLITNLDIYKLITHNLICQVTNPT